MSTLKKILLADNKDPFRETCVEFLQLRGYHAVGVSSPEECLQVVDTDPPQLLILDYRMRDDDDQDDDSGLTIAKQLPPHLPKIILTAFPTWELARDALTPSQEGPPPAAFFVSKLEGLEVLLKSVERVFEEWVRINWDLQVDWGSFGTNSMAHLIDPDLEPSILANRHEELSELLKRLFLNASTVQFDRLLWQQPGLVSLQVLISAHSESAEPVLALCGHKDQVQDEAAKYYHHLKQTNRIQSVPQLVKMAETFHYAALSYSMDGTRQLRLNSLNDLDPSAANRQVMGLRIDLTNQRAWIDGRLLRLTTQEFKLLCFLYDRADQLCTRQMIIEEFFHYQYDKMDDSQKALINTNISRLRSEVEVDPQYPKLIQTVHGRGYCLKLLE